MTVFSRAIAATSASDRRTASLDVGQLVRGLAQEQLLGGVAQQRPAVGAGEVRELLADRDQEQAEVAGAAGDLVDPFAGRAALDELPRLVDHQHRAAGEQAAVGLAQALGAAALDATGDVLGEHEQHRGGELARHLAGVEGDQRRVGGDGGLAVEQVGVGALVDERRDPLGERAQHRGDLLGAGLGLLLGAAAQLLAQQPLARHELLAGGAGVDGADGDLEQVALERVQAVGVLAGAVVADQQRVQGDEVGDLLDRRVGRVLDVPRVDGVLVGGGADRQVASAGDERAEELVVAGAVEHEGLHAVREEPRDEDVDEERLAAAGARVDQQRAVVVRGVERVDQRDLAARVGERERDPGRRPAAGADQRDGVADVAGDVLARQPRDVAARAEARTARARAGAAARGSRGRRRRR